MNKYAIRRLIFKIVGIIGVIVGFIMMCVDSVGFIDTKFVIIKIIGILVFLFNVKLLDIIYEVEEEQ